MKNIKPYRFFKSKWKHSESEHWIEFYPKFTRFHTTLDCWGYFDSRPVICTELTTLVFLGILIVFGFSLVTLFSLALLFVSWGTLYIKLPIDTGKDDECENPSWGIYFYTEGNSWCDSLWIRLGKKSKVIYMPWSWDHYRTSKMTKHKKWIHELKGNYLEFYDDAWKPILFTQTLPYKYILKSAGVQNVNATIQVSEREWRRKWLKWTKLGNKVIRSIDIEFDQEVGEESGSWKGGVLGCGFNMLKNESPEQCLKRMEQTRKF